MAGEFEPNDSRNVTGTASTEDGRWTNQAGRTPDAAGQPQQSQQNMGQPGMGQQGMSDPRDRQAQQFDSQSGQSGGTWGSDSSLKDQIREHMAVVGPDGQRVGTVDSVEGERIKLTRNDSPDGQHHYIECSAVDGIEDGQVRLSEAPDWSAGESSRGM